MVRTTLKLLITTKTKLMAKPLNIHPGKVLRAEFMEPMGLSAYRLAKEIDVPQSRLSAILNEKRGISADTALRLGRYFDTTAKFWLNLQNMYDLAEAAHQQGIALSTLPEFQIPLAPSRRKSKSATV